jgi:hypothetical protein
MNRCGSKPPIIADIDGRKLVTLQCVLVAFVLSLTIVKLIQIMKARNGKKYAKHKK